MHGEEAEAALTQLAKRGAAHAEKREEPLAVAGGEEASDADMLEVEDADAAPYIALAGNGVELVRAFSRAPPRTGAEACRRCRLLGVASSERESSPATTASALGLSRRRRSQLPRLASGASLPTRPCARLRS